MKTYNVRPPIGLITFCAQEQEVAIAGFVRNHKQEPNVMYIYKKLYYAAREEEDDGDGNKKEQSN